MPTLIYTTGPQENAINTCGLPGAAATVFVKALNNNSDDLSNDKYFIDENSAIITVNAFLLQAGREKQLVFTRVLNVSPQAFDLTTVNVNNLARYEIQITVDCEKPENVLLGVTGKTEAGSPVPSLALANSQLTMLED